MDLYPFREMAEVLKKMLPILDILESADKDSLISVYWRARVGDLRVRDDPDVITWLERPTSLVHNMG